MNISQIDKLKVILQELIITNNLSKSELEELTKNIYTKKEELDNEKSRKSKSNENCECDFPF